MKAISGELSLFVQETARQKINGVGTYFLFLSLSNQCKVARKHHAPIDNHAKKKNQKKSIFLHSNRDGRKTEFPFFSLFF